MLFGAVHILVDSKISYEVAKSALLQNRLGSHVGDMICNSQDQESRLARAYDVQITADSDEFTAMNSSDVGGEDNPLGRGLRWLLSALADQHASLRVDPSFVLEHAERLTEWGGSEAFALASEDGRLLKLRVFLNESACSRIVQFLRPVNAARHPAFPSLVDNCPLAVLTEFMPGKPFRAIPASHRLKAIADTAGALARLHEIVPDMGAWKLEDSHFAPRPADCYLCFSADANNVVVSSAGMISLIDLEAVSVGPRWVDVAWADDLLCASERERVIFRTAYMDITRLDWPSDDEWNGYRRQYLDWVLVQLEASLASGCHSGNVSVRLQQLRKQRNLLGTV